MEAIKEIVNMANMINTRLNRARAKYPASVYTNEIANRIIKNTSGLSGLLVTGIHGIQLTRSKKAWSKIPEGQALALLMDIADVGQMWVMEDNARDTLNKLGVDDTPENLKAIIEGNFNAVVRRSNVWDLAYDMRTKNQDLYDLFEKLRGNRVEDWDRTAEEIMRETILPALNFGDNTRLVKNPNAPLTYGINERDEMKRSAARAFGREKFHGNNDPATLRSYAEQWGMAHFGRTQNGVFTPATLTQEQIDYAMHRFNIT